MALGFPVPRPTVLGLAMNRDDRDFSDRDVAAMNTVRPHLVQGWRTVQDRVRLQSLVDAADDGLTTVDSGVLVLSDPPEKLTRGGLTTLYRYSHASREESERTPYPTEMRERAVRRVLGHQDEYSSQWAAIGSVAEKLSINRETLRLWVRPAETDEGRRPGLTTDERPPMKALERENKELRRANEIHRPEHLLDGEGAPTVEALPPGRVQSRIAGQGRDRSERQCGGAGYTEGRGYRVGYTPPR